MTAEYIHWLPAIFADWPYPADVDGDMIAGIFKTRHPELFEWLCESCTDWELLYHHEDTGDYYYGAAIYLKMSIVFYKKEEAALFILFHVDPKK